MKGAEAMCGRFETMEERRWRFGRPARWEGEMGAERFEVARRGVEGREGTGVGVIYPFRWRALSDYQYTLSLWWWPKWGASERGKQKGHLTSALPGHSKFRIFESHADFFWELVSAIYWRQRMFFLSRYYYIGYSLIRNYSFCLCTAPLIFINTFLPSMIGFT
jgi:hypothetical protein